MKHPYAELIGLKIDKQEDGFSVCTLLATEKLMNPHQVTHGAVIYSPLPPTFK